MKKKNTIYKISEILSGFDSDTVEAVYIALYHMAQQEDGARLKRIKDCVDRLLFKE